jgi:methyltransferase (TIGR00027 family)
MQLSDVSKTAIVTLRSRVIEAEKPNPLIQDPMAKTCLEQLAALASPQDKTALFDRKLASNLTSHIALRARKYDATANEFISAHPSPIVVNLGCGFDTRYWRIQHDKCRYFELDLPEIVALKREALGDKLAYELLGCSVFDTTWIDRVTEGGNSHILLMAEGLFMYLPKPQVIELFNTFSARLERSQIVLEVVTEKYTHGWWKKIVTMKMERELGLEAGASYDFGIRNAAELESYAPGIKVIDQWSYVEDPDTRPRILKYLGLTRTQWTVTAGINQTGLPFA